MNKFFILLLILLTSCNSDIATSNIEEIIHNPEITIIEENNEIHIILFDYPNISGFQFDLSLSENLEILSLKAFGGLSELYNFHIASSLLNLRVLSFSLTEEAIPYESENSNILIKLQIDYNGSGEVGLDNVILSGENGAEIEVLTSPNTISLP